MKLRKLVTLATLAILPATLAVACGGKDKTDDEGMGGAKATADSNAAEIEALKAQIAALEAQLATAAAETIPAINAEIADAQSRLDMLESCDNGGDCTGLDDTMVLTKLTDAYCEWAFGCCTDDEVIATLGRSAGDVDSCKAMYGNMLYRGDTSPYMPGFESFSTDDMAYFAELVQDGYVEIDADAVDACAEMIVGTSCEAEGCAEPEECGAEEADDPCDEMFKGLRKEGEDCAEGWQCEEGLWCVGFDSHANRNGVCTRGAVEGDICQMDDDCENFNDDLFCDENDGKCALKPVEGEACKFVDANLDTSGTVETPCFDSWCSPETSKCVNYCDSSALGDLCTSNGQCGDNAFCDFDSAETDENAYAGVCTAKFAAHSTVNYLYAGTQCESGTYYYNNTDLEYQCEGLGGDACDFANEGNDDCRSNVCDDSTDKCLDYCNSDCDCGAGRVCEGNACYDIVDAGDDCDYDDQCPTDYACEGTCAALPKNNGDCGATGGRCATGFACVYDECRPVTGSSAGADCGSWYHCSSERCDTDSTGECVDAGTLKGEGDACDADGETDIELDPCAAGLFCKRDEPNSATNTAGVCTAQLPPGALCDRSLNNQVAQCQGNVNCSDNDGLDDPSYFRCPVTYDTDDGADSCGSVFGGGLYGEYVSWAD